jgi:3'(2'), 5'-bisphosphate nucleotidase
MKLERSAETVCALAVRAGEAILEVYNGNDFDVALKSDSSPLTRADLAAHKVIEDGLSAAFPELPILSEESEPISWEQRRDWIRYWLVDPLDGTREFIKRNGEFTVNIALIERGVPVLGVVYAPVLEKLYWGYDAVAWCKHAGGAARAIQVIQEGEEVSPFRVVASRSHRSAELERFLADLPPHECVAMGSSLKFCLVADGTAHLYPRIGPTMEWDTAAADAIVRAAGGAVTTLNGEPLVYNKPELVNPYFLVKSRAVGV